MRFLFFVLCSFCLCFIPDLSAQTATDYETGYASYYPAYLDGRKTAYGEIYNQNKLTTAHRTHPNGTLLRVTRQDNGKSIIVRVNDKGPLDPSRVVDVSYAAAEALDLIYDGLAMVKVEAVDAKGQPISTAQASPNQAPKAYNSVDVPISYDYTPKYAPQKNPASVTAPAGSSIPKDYGVVSPPNGDLRAKSPDLPASFDQSFSNRIATPASGFFIQLGAFSQRGNAENLQNTLTGKGYNNIQIQSDNQLYKTLVGPFSSQAEAKQEKEELARRHNMKGFVTKVE